MSLVQVLVIEDDAAIRLGVCDALEWAGYSVTGAESGEVALDLLQTTCFDLVLLDVVLPGRNGLQMITSIRGLRPTQSIIMLTARGDVEDRVRGLKLGADDYVVKPFNVAELLARVEAVLRRAPMPSAVREEVELLDGVRINFRSRCLTKCDGQCLQLSEKESDLLRYLSTRPGQTIGRDELIEHVWGLKPEGIQTRTIDMHMARLREKLATISPQQTLIRTVRGQGYCFTTGSPP